MSARKEGGKCRYQNGHPGNIHNEAKIGKNNCRRWTQDLDAEQRLPHWGGDLFVCYIERGRTCRFATRRAINGPAKTARAATTSERTGIIFSIDIS